MLYFDAAGNDSTHKKLLAEGLDKISAQQTRSLTMMIKASLLIVLLAVLVATRDSNAFHVHQFSVRPTRHVDSSNNHIQPFRSTITNYNSNNGLHAMKRPILDQIATTLFKLENSRVNASSVIDDKGRVGEPMEWSEGTSLANKFSEVVSSNSLGYQFKQFVADIVAGDDYNKDEITEEINTFITTNPVAMYSFTTCPFCRRAKDVLDEKGISYTCIELDELDGNRGNEIRATLGRITKRTSVPSIFIDGKSIGGCNDGPGLIPLNESGELDRLLNSATSS